MLRTIGVLVLAGCLITLRAYSQPDRRIDRDTDVSRSLQDLFPVQTEGVDYQAVYDALAQLYADPLDLNKATRDELAATYLLSERQLSSLAAYRTDVGDLLSIYELQAVPDFDLPTIRRLLPFVTVSGSNLFGALPTPTDNYLIVRYEQVLEQQKGFTSATPDKKGNVPTRYLGASGQWYARYRYSRPRAFSMGFTLEKDPGELITWQPSARRYGADYVSFHAQLQNRGKWRTICLGDYQLQIGQGLVLSAGFVLGKSAETVQSIRRPTLSARPYTSLTESGFLRGITATYALRPTFDLTLLAARNRRDANMTTDSTGVVRTATSFQTSGLHRTQSELDDQGSLVETNLGAHLLYHTPTQLQLGVTLLSTTFDAYIHKRNLAYNRYEFTGQHNLVVGMHGSYVWRNWNLFSELARSSGSESNSGGIGAVGGALVSLTKKLDASILLRHYDRNFHSFYSNAFSEGSRTINESGAYVGIKYTVYRKLTLSGFIDYFRFPWLKYLIDTPSDGFDYLLQARYTPNRQTAFYTVFHDEYKQKNLTIGKVKDVVGTTRRSFALNAEYKLRRTLSLRSRVQWGTFGYAEQTPSRGFAFIQDATLDYRRLSLSGRIALFNTDDYDSRQYVYERDVLYAFSFPAYFSQGIRHYLLMQYNLNRHITVWVRWSRTDLTNQNTVGSDLDQISVPHKTEVKMQVRWRF